jgi:hypothetical protein
MSRPNYQLLLSGIPAMREVAAVRTRSARDQALRHAYTPSERSTIEGRYYDEVRQNRHWFDDQEAFLHACIEHEKGQEIVIPKRVRKPTRHIIGAKEYEDVLSPLELVGSMLAAGLPPEVQAVMLLVEGLIEGPASAERALIVGQIQAMVLDMYMRAEPADSGQDGSRLRAFLSAKRI